MLLRRRAAVVCFSILLGARGVFTEQLQQLHEEEPVQVFSNAVTDAEVADFEHLIQRGQTTACCGYWAQRAAANLQKFVVQQLHTDRRHLGDVHLDNITAVRGIRDEHSHWSSVAVLYLEDPGSTQVQLQRSSERHEVEVLPVARGSLVQVPEGAVLLHSEPLRVAWTRVRNAEAPPRDFFEFYLASWVQQTFVMPYDTTSQRRFFRKHTRHPRYWHGFLWSFVGTFCTVFPCLPLAWFGLQALARASKGEADSKDEGLSPTLLPRVGRKAGKAERSGPPSFGKAFGDLGLATDMVKDVSKS